MASRRNYPVFYFSDAINKASNSLIEYSYLIKKIVFPVKYIPLFKIISNYYIHLFFLFISTVLLYFFNFEIKTKFLQLPYYMTCLFLVTTPLYISSHHYKYFCEILAKWYLLFFNFFSGARRYFGTMK